MEDGEIQSLAGVWIVAAAAVAFYCYYISGRVPVGIWRLVSLLPVISLFIYLPFRLSSVHLGGVTFFYLVWLANFKLLLFAFGDGPLSPQPRLSLFHFTSIALLPINPKPTKNPYPAPTKDLPIMLAQFSIKLAILALIVRLYEYRESLHRYVILGLYCCNLYLGVELVLAVSVVLLRAALGFELEPQFDKPYLSTSLQDFWGRRWNLMVTRILRPTVYHPVRRVSSRWVGRDWGPHAAVFATFVVSGLMHELIYFYLTRARPTWEVTWFFALHGACTAAEVAAKKALGGRFRLHGALSGPITLGFVALTAVWLFLPQLLRDGIDLQAINEYSVLGSFARDNLLVFLKK